MADGNAKLFIEAQVIDNFKAIASKIKSGIEKIDTSVKIEVDDEEAKAQIESALSNIGRILGDTNGMAQYLDLSGVIPQILKTLQSGVSTNIKQNTIKSFESSLEAFETLTKNFGLNGDKAVSVIQELNESLSAPEMMKKYLEDLQSIYTFIKNIQGLSKKDKDSLFRSLTDSIKRGASANNLADAIGLKNIDKDFKDVDQFAFSAKEARSRLIEELEKWNELKEGSKLATKRNNIIAGLIARIESLSGQEFKDYLNSKLADDKTSGNTKTQVQKLLSLYTQKGGWGEHFLQWIDSDNKVVNNKMEEMQGVTDRVREMTKKQMEEREKILANASQVSSRSLSQNNQPSNSIIYSGEQETNQKLDEQSEYRKELADDIEKEVQKLKAKLNILKEIAGLQKEVIKSGVESTPEYTEMQFLQTAVEEVTEAVNNKTNAFIQEQGVVQGVVKSELQDLKKLDDKLNQISNFGDEEKKVDKVSKPRQDLEAQTDEQIRQAEEARKKAEEAAQANAKAVRKESVIGDIRNKENNTKPENKAKLKASFKDKNLPDVPNSSTGTKTEAQAMKDIVDYSEKATEGLKKFGDINDSIAEKVTTVADALKKEASALTSMSRTFMRFDDSKIVQQARKEKLQENLSEVFDKMKLSEQDNKKFEDSFMATFFDKGHLEDATAQLRNAYKDVVSFRDIYSRDASKENMLEMTKREAKLWSSYKEAEKQGILESNLEAKRLNPSLLGITQEKNSNNIKLLMQELNQRKQIYENYAKEAESIQNEIKQVENPPASKQLEKSDRAIKQYQEVISSIKEYIEVQKELVEIQKSTGSEPTETKFNAEQLEQFSTALSNISDSLTKIQTALGALDDKSDVPSIIKSINEMIEVFKKLGVLIDDINNKKLKFGFSSNPDEKLIGEMNSEEVKQSLTGLFDDAIKKIQDFKTNVDMSETVKNFKSQISEMEKAVKKLEKALEKEKKARENDKIVAKAKEEKRILEETRKAEEKARQKALAKEKAEQEQIRKQQEEEERKRIEKEAQLKKQQEERLRQEQSKVFAQGYSAQLEQQKREEKNAQKQFQIALEQKRLQEQVNNFNANKETTSKYNKELKELTLDQGRQFQLDEQKKKAEQAKKAIQTELEQSRLAAQVEQVREENSLKIGKTLEQNKGSQLNEQIKKAEQAKKITQIELEQARLAGQASTMWQKKEQERLKKEQDIKEYEKQFHNWGEEENGQLTFLDKDADEEYKKATQEEIARAQKIAKQEAQKKPIELPIEGQISFTSNEDIDQIIEIYTDKGRQQAEKQFANMRKTNAYINSETSIEKFIKPYENLLYGTDSTKNISELIDASSKLKDIKTELESSFDSENKMIGNPLRVQELFKQYDALTLKIKDLKALISSPTSQENIAIEMAKDAEKARDKINEASDSLDELKNKITSTFEVGRADEILTSKTESFIKSYGALSNKNDINTLTNPIVGSDTEEQQKKIIILREELEKYKIAVKELKELKNSDIVDLKTLTEANDKVKNLEISINAMMKSIRTSGTPNASSSQVNKFTTRIESFMIKNPRITAEAKESLQEYLDVLKSGESISKTTLEAMSNGFSKLQIEQEKAGRLGYNIWDQMLLKMREGVAFLATKFSFYEIFNQFRQGIGIVKDFDDALTEMQKVTDETMLTLQRYQKSTFDVAESIGSTALQVQQSTADFLRLGESLEEAAKSAKAANVLMNVSEFESINDATTSLIALGAAYDDLSKMNIIDKLNEVGNNYSISTSGAAEALQMSASALKTAGNSMDEAIALVTAGNQVVQDISKAGNGLRTIALRLTGKQMCPNIE